MRLVAALFVLVISMNSSVFADSCPNFSGTYYYEGELNWRQEVWIQPNCSTLFIVQRQLWQDKPYVSSVNQITLDGQIHGYSSWQIQNDQLIVNFKDNRASQFYKKDPATGNLMTQSQGAGCHPTCNGVINKVSGPNVLEAKLKISYRTTRDLTNLFPDNFVNLNAWNAVTLMPDGTPDYVGLQFADQPSQETLNQLDKTADYTCSAKFELMGSPAPSLSETEGVAVYHLTNCTRD